MVRRGNYTRLYCFDEMCSLMILKQSNISIHPIYIVGAFWQLLLSIRKYEVCLGINNVRKTHNFQYIVSKINHHQNYSWLTKYIYSIYCIENIDAAISYSC